MDTNKNFSPRDYQKAIFQTCTKENCLVVLPTGTGKTLIALMLAIHRFTEFPLEKILFLAPTRPLVEQHYNYFKKNLPHEDWADLQIFTGKTPADQRKKIWQTSEIIFSTPQCIGNDLKKNLYNLSDVSLLIEDECHRCLKHHSYNFVAQKYKQQAKNPRVLGLTASPGSDKATIQKVCNNLGIDAVEIRTRESEDVKPYLKELEFEKIELDFPTEFEEIRFLLKDIFNDKVNELRNRKVIFKQPSTTELLDLQRRLIIKLSQGDRNPNNMMAVSACATAIKLQHALTLLETQTVSALINYFKKMFSEAAEKKSRAVQVLTNNKKFLAAYTLTTTLTKEHPKLEKIKEIVKEKIKENPKAKIIIFAQFRDTVDKIADMLSKIPNVTPAIFVGQTKKKNYNSFSSENKNSGLKQSEQKQIIEDFKEGKVNCLIATSIGEEGLDIPEVSEVIFYEPVPSAIRKIQRTGRTARLAPGQLKILITKNTRDEIYHYVSKAKESRMHRSIEQIKHDYQNNKDHPKNIQKEEIDEEELKEEQKTLDL